MSLEQTIRSMYIKEDVEPIVEDGHQDVASAKRQCKTIIEDAQAILSALNSMDNEGSLPTWWTNKLAVASTDLNKMNDYISNPSDSEKEMDEAKVRGKEVYDKTFANRTQADNYAKKHGGRVQQVGRVFYVFKEELEEAVKYPHMMYDPKTGKEVEAKSPEDHEKYAKMGYTHDKPEEMDEAVNMAKVRSTYNDIMKGGRRGPPDDDEVGDYIGKGMTKADIAALIKMLAKQGYDAKFLTKDLAPLAENVGAPQTAAHRRAQRNPSKSGGSGYDLYHKDFSSAMKHAYDYAKSKLGVDIDPKEIDDKVASGPRKPSKGKTNSYRLMGKDGKKAVQIQVHGMPSGHYELNMYKESVELDEAMTTAIALTPSTDQNYKTAVGIIQKYRSQGVKAEPEKTKGNSYEIVVDGPVSAMRKLEKEMKQSGIKFMATESVELDEAYKTPAEAGAYEAGKKAARSGKKYDDNPNKKGSKEHTAWSKGHNEARAKGMKEEVKLDEKKDEPPFDVSKADYKGAAKELTQYAMTKGGMDKKDFLGFANRMSAIAGKKSPRVTARFARDLEALDTSPREKIISVMRNNGIKVTMAGRGLKIEGVGAELTAAQRLRAVMETEVPVSESEKPLTVGQSIMEKAIARIREAEGEKMTDAQLKRREEIAKDLPDDEFKKRYGDDWMSVKMATATKMAKGEK